MPTYIDPSNSDYWTSNPNAKPLPDDAIIGVDPYRPGASAPPDITYNPDGTRTPSSPIDDYWSRNKPLSDADYSANQEKIKEDFINRQREAINSIDNMYVSILSRANQQGQNRLGSANTINALSGQRGSASGAANVDNTMSANLADIKGIEAEKAAKVQEIMGKYTKDMQEELRYQNELRQKNTEQWLAYMGSKETENKLNSKAMRADFLKSNIRIEDIAPDQLQKIAEAAGYSVDQFKILYESERKAQEKAFADAEAKRLADLENQQTDTVYKKAQTKALGKPFEVSPGASIYDPATGKFLGTAPQKPADPKDNTITVGNSLLQYDSQTGTWKNIYTAPASAKNSIVEINGTDYQIDENGNLSAPKVPAAEVSQLKKDAFTSAQELLNKFNSGSKWAVGKSSLLPVMPGTAAADFVTQFNNLKSLLSLENIKYLKGQGQVSDAERKLLADASTKLSRSQTESEFQKTLEDVVKALSGASQNKTKEQLRAEFPQATPEEIDALFKEESGFKKVGGDTNKAVSYLGNYGAITGEGSPYWKWGLDVDLKKGDPVYSPVDGVVIQSGDKKDGFGNRVGIKTSKGNIVYLSHNDALDVKVGDNVKKGQKVAAGGNSGRTIASGGGDGSHLDITVKKPDGSYYKPEEIRQILS